MQKISEGYPITFCKPLRILELFVVSICFTFLHLTPTADSQTFKTLGYEAFLYTYAIFGALTIIAATDVVSQIFRHPMHNKPIAIFSLLSATFCLIAAFILFLQYITIPKTAEHKRVSFVILLVAGFSVVATFLYVIDAFLIIRLARR